MSKEFETVIGLEVHVQLKTNSKIFCACSTNFESPANSNICPVCCGYPGVLPVFNRRVLQLALRVCLALQCKQINERIYFERKNYFYPDLPKNYQISQYKMPLGEKGFLEVPSGKKICIERIHLEEDAGKLVHKENYSLVDLNRTGMPLLEIVSEPDIRSPEEAYDYLTYLKLILQYIGVSDCNMEKGTLRCDANISLRKKGDEKLGTKVELKNMNSFSGVRDALSYEEKRQAKVLSDGKEIFQETRLWDTDSLKTVVMRMKEEAHDYRYFPDPDLLDFLVSQEMVDQEKPFIKELPLEKRKRLSEKYGLAQKDVDFLITQPLLSEFFEESAGVVNQPQKIIGWLLGPFLEQVNILENGLDDVKLQAKNFAKIVEYFLEGKLNNLTAKKVLSLCINTDRDVDGVIKDEGLVQISDQGELSKFIEETLIENRKAIQEYLEGKAQAIMFLVGQVMKKTRGKANPQLVRQMLEDKIKEGKE